MVKSSCTASDPAKWLKAVAVGWIPTPRLVVFLVLCWTWSGVAAVRSFELPAGPAEQTLNAFAQQSGWQVVFPTEITQNVQTNRVQGFYAVHEALERLLADTILTAQFDEQSGIIAVTRRARPRERVVELPPYEVISDPLGWRYAQTGGIEMISACGDDVTRRMIEQLQRLQEAMGLILPPEFLVRSDVPDVYVLLNERQATGVTQNLVDELRRTAEQQRADSDSRAAAGLNFSLMRNYRFWDRDGQAIFFVVNEAGLLRGHISHTPGYLRDLLERRVPALQPWLVEGLMELYQTMKLEPYAEVTSIMEAKGRRVVSGGVVKIDPFQWISAADTALLKRGRLQADLLPMSKLFAAPPAPSDPAYRVWRMQSALFIRWALDGRKSPRREAFWQLLREADRGPVTEEHFRRAFNLSYAEAEANLAAYLKPAIRRDFELRPDKFAESAVYQLQPATESQISRVKGDLDRLMIRYVREAAPSLTRKYIEQAQRTLRRAYDLGDRDPRLLAQMGLCECDAGDLAAALPWLEAAVAGGVVRPRAYVELARIRYQNYIAATVGGRLNGEQIAMVIMPLEMVRNQAPPQVAAYELMAEVWMKHATALEAGQLAALDEGLRHFPRRVGLVAAVARLKQRHVSPAAAQMVLDRAIAAAVAPGSRSQLERLKRELADEGQR